MNDNTDLVEGKLIEQSRMDEFERKVAQLERDVASAIEQLIMSEYKRTFIPSDVAESPVRYCGWKCQLTEVETVEIHLEPTA